jgi:hypothetical protein
LSVEVIEDVGDDGGVFDASDDPHGAAAAGSGVDVDLEDAFKVLCPSHSRVVFGGRGSQISASPRADLCTCQTASVGRVVANFRFAYTAAIRCTAAFLRFGRLWNVRKADKADIGGGTGTKGVLTGKLMGTICTKPTIAVQHNPPGFRHQRLAVHDPEPPFNTDAKLPGVYPKRTLTLLC